MISTARAWMGSHEEDTDAEADKLWGVLKKRFQKTAFYTYKDGGQVPPRLACDLIDWPALGVPHPAGP